ncbi:MAG: NAD-dependent epimerase/dehydratase family protein [Actinomycetota bacterium]|nr:NAD-dependent epimerase/dehydratase family protein [Actinomycetota bacterium]
MNALVVGGAGFFGSHLTERLLAGGDTVDVVDDLRSGSLGNLADARSMGGELKIHTLDAAADEFHALVALRTPDVIYHLGLLPPGQPAEANAAAAIGSLMSVLEAARSLGGVKVVVPLSAVSLYGDVPAKEQPVKESQPWSPVGVRGVISRSVAELLTVYRERHAVEFTALALANVYGPRQRPDGGVVGAFARALHDRVTPMLQGDGRQTRDFLYIDDAVDALVRASQRGSGLVVNVGTGVATSIRDLWSLMAGPDGRPPAPSPRRPDDVARFVLSPTRARIHLAWAPWTDLAVGLRGLGRGDR